MLLLFRESGGNKALTTLAHGDNGHIGRWESAVTIWIFFLLSCGGWDSLLETLDLKPLYLTRPPQEKQLIKPCWFPLYLLERELTTLCYHQLIRIMRSWTRSPNVFLFSTLRHLGLSKVLDQMGPLRSMERLPATGVLPSSSQAQEVNPSQLLFSEAVFKPLWRNFKNGNPLKSTARSKAGHMALKVLFHKTRTCLPFDLACVFTSLALA